MTFEPNCLTAPTMTFEPAMSSSTHKPRCPVKQSGVVRSIGTGAGLEVDLGVDPEADLTARHLGGEKRKRKGKANLYDSKQ